jgi:hypothetical protein
MRKINGMLAVWGEILREVKLNSVKAEQSLPFQYRN